MFFERPDSGTRTLLVHVDRSNSDLASLGELKELAESAGLNPARSLVSNRRNPHPATFLGQGKVLEIAALVRRYNLALVVFGNELTPSQERNLERACNVRVIDRTNLILQIFSQRARTHEGKLQVELAQLAHASTRLIRGWTHLDRQRGGSGRGRAPPRLGGSRGDSTRGGPEVAQCTDPSGIESTRQSKEAA